jgi:DNA-binding response OmpR family regulator
VAHRARARGTTFDLAVIDARLTGSDAVVLARQVRESTGLPGSRIILLGSVQDRTAFRENCLRHGYAFLHKPIARRQLPARCSGIHARGDHVAWFVPIPAPTDPGDFAGAASPWPRIIRSTSVSSAIPQAAEHRAVSLTVLWRSGRAPWFWRPC